MILGDFHTHSTLDDGKSTLAEMVSAARALGLTRLGLSGHSWCPMEEDFCISREGVPGYLEEARAQIDWGLAQCDVLKIADNELLFMTGQSDFEKGAAILQKQYPNIRLMNVTAGAQGSYSFCGDVHTFQPGCTLGGVIETTGAGDTFCASVLNFVLEHGLDGLSETELAAMLRFANAAAYLVTTKKGAIRSMPAREQVEDVLRRM